MCQEFDILEELHLQRSYLADIFGPKNAINLPQLIWGLPYS